MTSDVDGYTLLKPKSPENTPKNAKKQHTKNPKNSRSKYQNTVWFSKRRTQPT